MKLRRNVACVIIDAGNCLRTSHSDRPKPTVRSRACRSCRRSSDSSVTTRCRPAKAGLIGLFSAGPGWDFRRKKLHTESAWANVFWPDWSAENESRPTNSPYKHRVSWPQWTTPARRKLQGRRKSPRDTVAWEKHFSGNCGKLWKILGY
jgi:hypothetical protein